jgi:hypothetical protein
MLPDALVFSTTSVPAGTYGTVYTPQTLLVTGGTAPYSFVVSQGNLPAGMSLSPDGTLSGTPTVPGSYSFTVTAQDATPAPDQLSATQAYNLTVNKASLTVTAANATKLYGAAIPTLAVIYSGFVNGDNSASLTTQPTVSTTATAASPVLALGGYPITATNAQDPNYEITYVPGTLTVTPAPLTATADNKTITYGDAIPAFTVSYNGFVNGDNASNLILQPIPVSLATFLSPAGTYTILLTPLAISTNYTVTFQNGTLTISKAVLTVTADNKSMSAGGSVPNLTFGYSGWIGADGLLPGLVLTSAPTISTTATSASPAGAYPITLTGGAAVNYSFNYVNAILTVTGKPALTITANPATSLYGAPLTAGTVSYNGFVDGDDASTLATQPTVTNSATASSPVGTYVLTPAGASSSKYDITYVNGVYTITPAILTITADNKSMTYGAALPALTVSYSGFVNGDNPAKVTTAPAVTTTATPTSPVTTYPITAANAIVPNYTINYIAGTITVGKANLTVTANNQSMPVGGPLPALTISYSGFVGADNAASLSTQPTISTTATAASPSGIYPITVNGGASNNYNLTYNNGSLTVGSGRPTLTITANSGTSVYGAPLAAGTVTYSGFTNGDGPGNLTTQPTVTNSAIASSPVGTYVLTPGGASSPNYDIVYVNSTYTITPAQLTITANNATMPYGGPLPVLIAKYTGFVNGDDATKLTTPATLTTTATATSPVANYPITVTGAASPNYIITNVSGILTVTPATLTVTAVNKTMTQGGPLPTFTFTYSGFVGTDNAASLTAPPTATTTATIASPVGSYPITPAGGSSPNYNFIYVNGTLIVNAKPVLTITASPATSVYGAPLVAGTVTYSGFLNGDGPANLTILPTVTNSAAAGSPVGSYTLTPGGALSPTYAIQYVNGTYTITAATLTVTANNANMTYGGTAPALSVTYSGFVNGDNTTKVTTAPTVTTTATSTSPIGTYPITAANAVVPNYTINYVPGTLTVGKANLTVTADNKSMPLGGPLPVLTISYTGFVGTDNAAGLTTQPTVTTAATATSPTGSYPITVTGGTSSNYNFTYANGTLSVGKAQLTITASNATSVYGAPLVAGTVTYNGFVNGDGPGNLTTQPTVANTATTGSPVGNYVLTPGGASSPNYDILYVNGAYTITAAALTVTANNANITYGGTVPALSVTYSGFVNGDNTTKVTTAPTVTTTATSTSAVGTYPITAAGAAVPNYTINYVPGTLTVGKAILTVTADNKSMPLGGPLPALTITYSGFAGTDNVASLTTQPTVTTTATAASPVGNYPITPAGGAATNYDFNYVNGTLAVGKALLTITASPATSVYGSPLVAGTVTFSGFVNGDGPASLTTQPAVANTATAGSPVGNYILTPGGASSPNYNIQYVNGTYTISPAQLTITANNASITYGGAVPALSVFFSGFVNGDDATKLTTAPTVTTTATSTSPVGTYPITAAGAASPNYTIGYTAGTLTIGKAGLTVTADNKTMPLGGPLPALTITYSGFVGADNAASLTAQPTVTTTASAASPSGSYPITPAGGTSANYNFNYVNGTLSVGKALLTITANPAGSVYGAPLVAGTITYSGFVNGDGPASLTTQPTVANSAVAGSPAGNYVLTPAGAASPNYTIVYVNGAYSITPAALTITAANQTITYGGTIPALTVTYSGFVNGDDASKLTTPPAVTTTATSASPVGIYPIAASGAASPNYTISYVPATLAITRAVLTVTADNKTMPLGGPLPALTITYSGFVNGDNAAGLTTAPTVTTTATAISAAGTYPINPSGGTSPNYLFSYANGTLSVGKAILTVTANPAGSVYGASIAAGSSLTVTYTGFVNGDGPASLTTPVVVTNSAFTGAPVGTYALTPSGASSPNYTIVYVNSTYTVSPATLTISAVNQTMTYGSPIPTLVASYSGFVNGDNPATLATPPAITTTATTASPAGTYPITVSGAASPNYTIAYNAGVLTIGKATLTIVADSKTMPLGGPVPALTISYSGFVNGDNPASLTQQPSINTTATVASPAGSYPITVAGATSPNYTFTYVTGILAVGKALLTITVNPAGSAYGSPLAAASSLKVSYSGFVNGDGPASLTQQPTIANQAFAGAPAGTYALIASGAQDENYAITYVNGIYTISPAPLTVTANNQTMTYGSPVPSLTASYTGFVNGDNASRLTIPPTVTTTASIASPPGTYSITASGAVNPNYTITYKAGTLTIQRATLTITPSPVSMTYGGTMPTLTPSYSGFANGDDATKLTTPPTLTTTATATSPAGTYPITASGAVSPNYILVYNTGTFTIDPAALHVTAQVQTKNFGDADPNFTYTANGFVNGDNSSVITGALSRVPGENLGTYAITQGSLSAGSNYKIDFTGNSLTITTGKQKITWTQSLVVGCNAQTKITLTATASSGLPVTYTVADPTIASVSGNVLTLLQPGSTVITASQAGDANNTPAQDVTDTIHYQAASLITQRWNDVIFFDNSSGDYVQWQWYKDGDAVSGATDPYYSESPSLNGQYYVMATNKDSQRVQSCTLSITPGAAIPGGIKVYPNPANAAAQVTVNSNYSNTELQGAVLSVIDLSGKVRQKITNVQPSMQVTMPGDTGTYIVNLMLVNGQKASVNVLVIY